MKLSAILEPLIAAGVPGDVILATVRAFEAEAETSVDESKEKARARWRKWKANQPANVGKRLQTDANVSKRLAPDPAHVEDNLPSGEISGKKEEKKVLFADEAKKPAKGTRLPADFIPDMQVAADLGLAPSKASFESAKFLDYWRAKSGKDATKQDWPATWRNWCRKALESAPQQRFTATAPPHPGEEYNNVLNMLQGKSPNGHAGPTIDASVNRADSSGASNPLQLHALPSRNRT